MTKIKSRLTKIITSILGFFGIMSFTSCYGMVAMYGMGPNYGSVHGYVQGDIDGDGELENVPGIKVVLKSTSASSSTSSEPDSGILSEPNLSTSSEPPGSNIVKFDYTDSDGNYDIYSRYLLGNYIIEFIDVDNAENGEFETYSANLKFTGEDEYEEKSLNPILVPKKKSE